MMYLRFYHFQRSSYQALVPEKMLYLHWEGLSSYPALKRWGLQSTDRLTQEK